MATFSQIADALLAHCQALSIGSPALPVAMPEVSFDPPVDGQGKPLPYLEVSLFLNRPAWEGVADGQVQQGILQITVVWPRHAGLIKPLEAADEVADNFAKNMRLAHGLKVSAEPYAASPITEDRTSRVPVSIPWTA